MATRKKIPAAAVQPATGGKVRQILIRDYMNTAMKAYSLASNIRNIPAMDGLKPSQRKALYGTAQRGESAALLQVERLSSVCMAATDYHHGGVSMESTLVNLARNRFPGSNNMNLLIPDGQFGTRLTSDPGASRYISTALSPYFRQLFKKEDEVILQHNYTDGDKIEPVVYLPLLPLALINGVDGTGTGHASMMLQYHPDHLRDACLKVLNGKELKKYSLTPWFRGYNGTVERDQETGQVRTIGNLEIVNSTTIRITELPVGVFVDDYKDVLNSLEEVEFIKSYVDGSNEDSFDFIVTVPRTVTAMSHDALLSKFKLIGRTTENFTIWNPAKKLFRYPSPEAIVEVFTRWRLNFYFDRLQKLIDDTDEAIRYQRELIRFIKFFIANTKKFRDTSKAELVDLMLQNEFSDYERLLSMPIWSLTKDRIEDAEVKLKKLIEQLGEYHGDDAVSLYKRELTAFKYNPNL